MREYVSTSTSARAGWSRPPLQGGRGVVGVGGWPAHSAFFISARNNKNPPPPPTPPLSISEKPYKYETPGPGPLAGGGKKALEALESCFLNGAPILYKVRVSPIGSSNRSE